VVFQEIALEIGSSTFYYKMLPPMEKDLEEHIKTGKVEGVK
jgi:hypothetical protein